MSVKNFWDKNKLDLIPFTGVRPNFYYPFKILADS